MIRPTNIFFVVNAVVAGACVVFGADRADACGGLFCSQASPTPVDQAAERILFEILDDGSVSATVEIKYQGNPNEFSWIVPVTGTPDFIEVAGKDELQLLDAATAPSFLPPRVTCPGSACGNVFPSAPSDGSAEEGEGENGGVNVIAYPSVGPFDDIVVVDGGDATVLMAWLTDHGYQVNDKMKPFIEQYTVEGYKFLATRLRADADVQDMVPIRFHCPQPDPEIPLRLTAISAEPEMGFLVFVAGPERYAPLNYADVRIDTDDLRLGVAPDGTIATNYFATISKRIDDEGGRGFVTEAARTGADVANAVLNVELETDGDGDGDDTSRERLVGLLRERAFVTRFYARMNAEEMTVDPIFAPAGNVDVDFGDLDLSAQESPVECALQEVPTCGTLYCGDGDACAASVLGVDGCVCRDDHVARAINAPGGGLQVSCMPPDIDLHGGGGDPCSGVICGEGTCLPVNDRPTCRCSDDAVAIIDDGRLRCADRVGREFESEQLLWPDDDDNAGCDAVPVSVRGARVGSSLSLALLFATSLVLRRRRRG